MKNKYLHISLGLILLLFCCSSFGQTYSFMFGGMSRSYIVHLPTAYSAATAYPLVLNMHGYTGSASQQQSYTQMNTVADTGKFIVVYPNGVNNAWNCGAFGFDTNIDDVGFLSALIDTLEKKYTVNANKVFACGFSLGGFMSYRLACELSNRIAAIGSVSGLMADGVTATCQSTCPVPVIHFHGTADGTINYNGAAGYNSVDAAIQHWVAQDGCGATPVVTNVPDINTTDGCTVTKSVYSQGLNSSEVILFKITGGSHAWPGSAGNLGATDQDIKASGEIWKFFRNKYLQCNMVTGVGESAISENHLTVFPNPSNGVFNLSLDKVDNARISVYTVYGKYVYEQILKSANPQIDLSAQPNGVYFIQLKTPSGCTTSKVVISK